MSWELRVIAPQLAALPCVTAPYRRHRPLHSSGGVVRAAPQSPPTSLTGSPESRRPVRHGLRADPPKKETPMFARKIVLSSFLASAVALSGGMAFAATVPSNAHSQHAANGASKMLADGDETRQCIGLESAFDQGIKGHENMAAFQDAKALRKEGAKMCAEGADAAGITYLKTAVSEIGVVPKVY